MASKVKAVADQYWRLKFVGTNSSAIYIGEWVRGEMSILGKLKKVLGALTDILLIGRARGWWSRKNQPDYRRKKK